MVPNRWEQMTVCTQGTQCSPECHQNGNQDALHANFQGRFLAVAALSVSILYIYAYIAGYAVSMFEHDAGPFHHLQEQIAMADGYTVTHLNATDSVQTRCCYGPDSCNPTSDNFFFYICCWNCACPCMPTGAHY
mmetsp:Transcript_37804/g.55527  ORF Transcript_37804/g.55527 Transcript_37804/m.55527 type:complete len:134 (-) Transcript_37804:55-456(-)